MRCALFLAVGAGAAAIVSPASAAINVAITSPAGGAHSLSGVQEVDVTASADLGVYGVQLSVDGQPYGVLDTMQVSLYRYAIAWDTTGLAPGTHTLLAVAQDWSGTAVSSAPITVDVGSAYPTIALGTPLPYTLVHGVVSITAAMSSGAGSPVGQFTVDGAAVSTSSSASTATASWDTTKTADGTHTIAGTVTDSRGAQASASESVTVDNTPPTTYLIAPTAGATFLGTLPVQAHASDAWGIGNVRFAIDGTAVGSAVATPDTSGGYTYSAQLTISALANGTHTLTDVATDSAGNTTTSAPVPFTVGVLPPAVAITAPLPYSFASKTLTITATVAGTTIQFGGRLLIDGLINLTPGTRSGTTLTFALNTASLSSGTHTIAVAATNGLTVIATSPPVSVTVDNTPPTAVLYLPTPLPGYAYARDNGPTQFEVHASDAYGIKSVQFTVDGTPAGPLLTAPIAAGSYLYATTFDTSTLASGLHTLSATVTDNAGNVASPAALTLKTGAFTFIPVLNYHGITGPLDTSPDQYDQTPAEADAQLAYLKANGYQSISLAQYEAWLTSGTLPAGIAKPVLITVDDGLTDEEAWDPLLQKYGFTAVLYVVTGFADATTPGVARADTLTWAQIQAYAANGRWQIAFHGGQYGHGDYSQAGTTITLGTGRVESFAPTCFAYYNCLGTITTTTTTGIGILKKTTVTTAAETPAQFEARVTAEVTAGIAELKLKVPTADTTAWACPWNACGQWTTFYNDASGTLQAWLPGYFASLFPVVFMQTDPATYGAASGLVGALTAFDRHYRFEVLTTTTIDQFAAALTDPGFANN